MTRKTILAIFLIFVFANLWACTNEIDYPVPEETTQAQNEDDILDEGPNWAVFRLEGGGVGYTIFDNAGNELFTTREIRKGPGFTLLEENLLRVDDSGGSNLRFTQFYNLNPLMPRVSALFSNVLAVNHGLVVYLASSGHEHSERIFTVVVHDIFDPRYDHISFQREFGAYGLGPPFTAPVEFIDENTLFIAYVNRQGERVEERLALR